jgi:hypothetical protein
MCIQDTNEKDQGEIRSAIERCKKSSKFKHITECYIAEKLGLTTQTFSYQLTTATNFSSGLYKEVKKILIEEGAIKEPSEALKRLNNSLMETQTTVFHQLELMTLSVKGVGSDGRYDDDEVPIVLKTIENIQREMNQRFEKMKREVE